MHTSLASPSATAAVHAAPARRTLRKRLHDYAFRKVHGSTLIYNTCWEDPRLDREVMRIDSSSRIAMITSAGCNALDYLLDDAAEIHAVDMNPRQNALVELKRALFEHATHDDLFALLGDGSTADYRAILGAARPHMPDYARTYWDRKARYFDPAAQRGSFYYYGGSGLAAWFLRQAIRRGRRSTDRLVREFLDAPDHATQRALYARLEPEVWTKATNWLVRQPSTMALLGVPRPQIKLIMDSHPRGLTGFVQDKFRHAMSELPIGDNYFWRVYMTGRYSRECCPNYLRREHFATLASRVRRLRLHTSTLSDFLRRNPAEYTHFVLLDHQDWLAAHDPAALREEWDLIFANSRPGTRILLRSAGLDLGFIPEDIRARVAWDEATCARLHALDRVGTYGSMHFGEVRR